MIGTYARLLFAKMTTLPDNLTQTPHTYAGRGPRLDVLDEILSALRLTGGVVVDGEFNGDFCVLAQFTPRHFAPFFPKPETLICYHYVRSGEMIIEVDGMPPQLLEAGTVAILPRNDPHKLASRSGLEPSNAKDALWVTNSGVHQVVIGEGEPKREIWCGFLGAAKDGGHPLLDALPPLLTLDVSAGEAQWLESSMRFVAEQSPPARMVAKLAELFVAQAIREYVEHLPPSSRGWLRGLTDPAVSKALSIIHSRYSEELDVEILAREAGVSRSVLGERFSDLLNESPMRYCARWRMRIAANLLREGKLASASIAYAVGFGSEAAFNRAFKREFNAPPATWKREEEARERSSALELAAHDSDPNQVIVSGTPTAVHWLSKHIAEFLEANSDLSVLLDPDPRLVSFENDDVDCAIRCGIEAPTDLVAEELFKVDFTPMCSPAFLASHPGVKDPAAILDVPRITPNDGWWDVWCKRFALKEPAGTLRGVEMGAQVLDGVAAMGGQGVALLTPLFWHDELSHGRLVCPQPNLIEGMGIYWLVYPEARSQWSKVRRFSDWLHGLCAAAKTESSPPS